MKEVFLYFGSGNGHTCESKIGSLRCAQHPQTPEFTLFSSKALQGQ